MQEHLMFTAKQYRAKAAESAESGKQSNDPGEIRKYQRLEKSFTELAKNEDWLANNFDKIIHSNDIPNQDDNGGARANIAESEERILRCLGAAVIMHWSTIPKTLQRELFDTAGSMGDVLKSTAQRAQIARFLHGHKNPA
jgi:hypothetical protein